MAKVDITDDLVDRYVVYCLRGDGSEREVVAVFDNALEQEASLEELSGSAGAAGAADLTYAGSLIPADSQAVHRNRRFLARAMRRGVRARDLPEYDRPSNAAWTKLD